MVTHDASLPKIATRVVVMSDGKVKEEIQNTDEQRFEALNQLNEGIEDLSVFEQGSQSVESNRNCSRTEFRKPSDYEDAHVLESTEHLFDYSHIASFGNSTSLLIVYSINSFHMKIDTILIILSIFVISISFMIMIKMNKDVTEPYMDEIFHFPMTQRYFNGIWLFHSIFIN